MPVSNQINVNITGRGSSIGIKELGATLQQLVGAISNLSASANTLVTITGALKGVAGGIAIVKEQVGALNKQRLDIAGIKSSIKNIGSSAKHAASDVTVVTGEIGKLAQAINSVPVLRIKVSGQTELTALMEKARRIGTGVFPTLTGKAVGKPLYGSALTMTTNAVQSRLTQLRQEIAQVKHEYTSRIERQFGVAKPIIPTRTSPYISVSDYKQDAFVQKEARETLALQKGSRETQCGVFDETKIKSYGKNWLKAAQEQSNFIVQQTRYKMALSNQQNQELQANAEKLLEQKRYKRYEEVRRARVQQSINASLVADPSLAYSKQALLTSAGFKDKRGFTGVGLARKTGPQREIEGIVRGYERADRVALAERSKTQQSLVRKERQLAEARNDIVKTDLRNMRGAEAGRKSVAQVNAAKARCEAIIADDSKKAVKPTGTEGRGSARTWGIGSEFTAALKNVALYSTAYQALYGTINAITERFKALETVQETGAIGGLSDRQLDKLHTSLSGVVVTSGESFANVVALSKELVQAGIGVELLTGNMSQFQETVSNVQKVISASFGNLTQKEAVNTLSALRKATADVFGAYESMSLADQLAKDSARLTDFVTIANRSKLGVAGLVANVGKLMLFAQVGSAIDTATGALLTHSQIIEKTDSNIKYLAVSMTKMADAAGITASMAATAIRNSFQRLVTSDTLSKLRKVFNQIVIPEGVSERTVKAFKEMQNVKLGDVLGTVKNLGESFNALNLAQKMVIANMLGGRHHGVKLLALLNQHRDIEKELVILKHQKDAADRNALVQATKWDAIYERQKNAFASIFATGPISRFFKEIAEGFILFTTMAVQSLNILTAAGELAVKTITDAMFPDGKSPIGMRRFAPSRANEPVVSVGRTPKEIKEDIKESLRIVMESIKFYDKAIQEKFEIPTLLSGNQTRSTLLSTTDLEVLDTYSGIIDKLDKLEISQAKRRASTLSTQLKTTKELGVKLSAINSLEIENLALIERKYAPLYEQLTLSQQRVSLEDKATNEGFVREEQRLKLLKQADIARVKEIADTDVKKAQMEFDIKRRSLISSSGITGVLSDQDSAEIVSYKQMVAEKVKLETALNARILDVNKQRSAALAEQAKKYAKVEADLENALHIILTSGHKDSIANKQLELLLEKEIIAVQENASATKNIMDRYNQKAVLAEKDDKVELLTLELKLNAVRTAGGAQNMRTLVAEKRAQTEYIDIVKVIRKLEQERIAQEYTKLEKYKGKKDTELSQYSAGAAERQFIEDAKATATAKTAAIVQGIQQEFAAKIQSAKNRFDTRQQTDLAKRTRKLESLAPTEIDLSKKKIQTLQAVLRTVDDTVSMQELQLDIETEKLSIIQQQRAEYNAAWADKATILKTPESLIAHKTEYEVVNKRYDALAKEVVAKIQVQTAAFNKRFNEAADKGLARALRQSGLPDTEMRKLVRQSAQLRGLQHPEDTIGVDIENLKDAYQTSIFALDTKLADKKNEFASRSLAGLTKKQLTQIKTLDECTISTLEKRLSLTKEIFDLELKRLKHVQTYQEIGKKAFIETFSPDTLIKLFGGVGDKLGSLDLTVVSAQAGVQMANAFVGSLRTEGNQDSIKRVFTEAVSGGAMGTLDLTAMATQWGIQTADALIKGLRKTELPTERLTEKENKQLGEVIDATKHVEKSFTERTSFVSNLFQQGLGGTFQKSMSGQMGQLFQVLSGEVSGQSMGLFGGKVGGVLGGVGNTLSGLQKLLASPLNTTQNKDILTGLLGKSLGGVAGPLSVGLAAYSLVKTIGSDTGMSKTDQRSTVERLNKEQQDLMRQAKQTFNYLDLRGASAGFEGLTRTISTATGSTSRRGGLAGLFGGKKRGVSEDVDTKNYLLKLQAVGDAYKDQVNWLNQIKTGLDTASSAYELAVRRFTTGDISTQVLTLQEEMVKFFDINQGLSVDAFKTQFEDAFGYRTMKLQYEQELNQSYIDKATAARARENEGIQRTIDGIQRRMQYETSLRQAQIQTQRAVAMEGNLSINQLLSMAPITQMQLAGNQEALAVKQSAVDSKQAQLDALISEATLPYTRRPGMTVSVVGAIPGAIPKMSDSERKAAILAAEEDLRISKLSLEELRNQTNVFEAGSGAAAIEEIMAASSARIAIALRPVETNLAKIAFDMSSHEIQRQTDQAVSVYGASYQNPVFQATAKFSSDIQGEYAIITTKINNEIAARTALVNELTAQLNQEVMSTARLSLEDRIRNEQLALEQSKNRIIQEHINALQAELAQRRSMTQMYSAEYSMTQAKLEYMKLQEQYGLQTTGNVAGMAVTMKALLEKQIGGVMNELGLYSLPGLSTQQQTEKYGLEQQMYQLQAEKLKIDKEGILVGGSSSTSSTANNGLFEIGSTSSMTVTQTFTFNVGAFTGDKAQARQFAIWIDEELTELKTGTAG